MSSLGGMEGIKGQRNERQSDRAEKSCLKWALCGPFRGRKSDIFDIKCFLSISRSLVPTGAGSTFSENQ